MFFCDDLPVARTKTDMDIASHSYAAHRTPKTIAPGGSVHSATTRPPRPSPAHYICPTPPDHPPLHRPSHRPSAARLPARRLPAVYPLNQLSARRTRPPTICPLPIRRAHCLSARHPPPACRHVRPAAPRTPSACRACAPSARCPPPTRRPSAPLHPPSACRTRALPANTPPTSCPPAGRVLAARLPARRVRRARSPPLSHPLHSPCTAPVCIASE